MECGDEEGGEGEAVGAEGERGKATHEAATPDSHLSPAARLRLYENQRWRMEVYTLVLVKNYHYYYVIFETYFILMLS